jgi:FG-GAP-like repeat
VVGSHKYGDVFWQSCPNGNCVGGQISMWVMNGFNIANTVNLGTTANFSVAGTGDFDGNDSEDLLLSDGKGDVAIWLLSGTKVISAALVTPPAGWPASNWSIAQAGDFNGDGYSDILFFDASGNVGIWYMKGVNVAGFATFPSAGNGWVPQGLNAD